MGIDADVLLRIRDRKALRDALRAHAAAKRKAWADEGREAEYEELLRDGYDPTPLIRPLDDGSALIFTGLRFHDEDMEFSIRCWLDDHFGSALGAIHDDPRGVFVSPDICEPKARTYDGVIEELAKAGRFINPAPPTDEEREERVRAFEAFAAGIDAVHAASASGDPAALDAALAAAPAAVQRSWQAQTSVASRLTPLVRISLDAEEPEARPADASVGRRVLDLMGISTRAEDGPVDAAKLGAMLESFLSGRECALEAAPLGFGRVSMLLPAHVAKAVWALTAGERSRLDVQGRVDLADGSSIIVTSRVGESVMEAMSLAEVLEAARVDRRALGPLPFFRESSAEEIAAAASFEAARSMLGDRAEMLPVLTSDEYFAQERSKVGAWLERDD